MSEDKKYYTDIGKGIDKEKCFSIIWQWVGQFAGTDAYKGWFKDRNYAWNYAANMAKAKTKDGTIWNVVSVDEIPDGECI